MDEDVKELLHLARLDLESALTVYDCAPACFFSQQASEKYLKAFLAFHSVKFDKTHNLARLLSLCERIAAEFSQLHGHAQILAPYAVDVRYREPVVAGAKDDAARAMHAGWRIRDFVMARLPVEWAQHDSVPR